jgi:hypothetical protein
VRFTMRAYPAVAPKGDQRAATIELGAKDAGGALQDARARWTRLCDVHRWRAYSVFDSDGDLLAYCERSSTESGRELRQIVIAR